ncbi:unnamed protein product [Allacma fusca]|uniref:Uncharacterized protein n=1 Tax=Allacma fusca TaxID=39272 RepID=A0A8J2KPD8_9HEXA|nr:unnamed protein product [Allacma fusca]
MFLLRLKTGLKMCCFCCKSEEGHKHDAAPNQDSKYSADPSTLNLGIYLDEDIITVGTITPKDTKEPEIIVEIPAEITFFNEKIMIGSNSEKNRMHENHFRVYDLIKETASPSPVISLTSGQYPLTEEEILAIFLEQLLSKIKSTKNVAIIGNVVITLPFNVTSFEKERIEVASKAAGFHNLRIMSSLLATAVAFARTKKYYRQKKQKIHSIFVSQYLRQSFNMALVDIGPDFIATRKCTSSINLHGDQDKNFEDYHTRMFEDKQILSQKSRYVYSVYKQGVRRLESFCKRIRNIDPVVIKTTSKQSTLDNNYMEIFRKEVQFTVRTSGPLTGACLLASRFQLTNEIPKKITVCDASLTNLIVTSPISRNRRGKIQNKNYCPNVIFKPKIKISPGKENIVILKEEYFKHRVKSSVGRYNIEIEKENTRRSRIKIQLRCRVDRDGIFGVSPIFPPGTTGSIMKINAPTVNTETFSEFTKLRSYYKALQTGSYSPPYPRFYRLTSIPEGSKEDLLEPSETEKLISTDLSVEIPEDDDDELEPDDRQKYSPLEKSFLAVGEGVNSQENGDQILWQPQNVATNEDETGEDADKNIRKYMLEEIWSYDFAIQKFKGRNPEDIEAEHRRLKAEAEEEFKLKIASAGIQMKAEWLCQLGDQLLYKNFWDEVDSDAGIHQNGSKLVNDITYERADSDRAGLDDALSYGVREKIENQQKLDDSFSSSHEDPLDVSHTAREIQLNASDQILRETVKPEEIYPELQPVIKEALNKFIEVGFKHHRDVMYEIVDKKVPFTDVQITLFHKDNLVAVKSTFMETFIDLLAHPILKESVISAANELERKVDFQLLTYLKRYEVTMEALMRKVKEYTLLAESQYDDQMEKFEHKQKTKDEVQAQHDVVCKTMLANFEKIVIDTVGGWNEIWKFEIEEKLQEKLEELLEESMRTPESQDDASLQIDAECTHQLGNQLHDSDTGICQNGAKLISDVTYETVDFDEGQLAEVILSHGTTEKKIENQSNIHDDPLDGGFTAKEINIITADENLSETKEQEEIYAELQPVIKEALNKFVDVGFKHHRNVIYGIIDKKVPFTDGQITLFHNDNLVAVKSAFMDTFNDLLAHPILKESVISAANELERKVDFQLLTYLKRYEVTMAALMKKVKEYTLLTESQYDDQMEKFEHKQKTKDEVQAKHDVIEEKLQEKLEELLEECLRNPDSQDEEFQFKGDVRTIHDEEAQV